MGETGSIVHIEGSPINIGQNSNCTVNLGTYDTNVEILGQMIDFCYHINGTTNIINMYASSTNIGTIGIASTINIGNVSSAVNVEASTIIMEAPTINIGTESVASSINIGNIHSSTVNMESSTINIGTAGFASNINIGNVLSTVRIQSIPGTAIGVNNFFDQFA